MNTGRLQEISISLVLPGHYETTKGQIELTDHIFLYMKNQRNSLAHPFHWFPNKALPKCISQDIELRASQDRWTPELLVFVDYSYMELENVEF